MPRLKLYNQFFINPFLLQKKSIIVFDKQDDFEKVILQFSLNNLKSEEDLDTVEAHRFLSLLGGQKSCFTLNKGVYVGSKKNFKMSTRVTLRKKKKDYFLDYFFTIVMPLFIRRYGVMPLASNKSFVELSIQDLSLLFDFKNTFRNQIKLKIFLEKKETLSGFSVKDSLSFLGTIPMKK